MKISLPAAAPAALLTICALVSSVSPALGQGTTIPLTPTGELSAFPTLVRTGTHPTLTWSIDYPEVASPPPGDPETGEGIVTIDPDGGVTPKTDLCMDVRVLGASYQTGVDNKGKPIWGLVRAEIKVGSGSWTQFFYDTQNNVKPNKTAFSQATGTGQTIQVRAQAKYGSSWLPWRSSGVSSPNVVPLVNGDRPPVTIAAFSQGNIESFLRPYLDADGKINIGPKDVIYLIELGQTDTTSSGFDLQDLVVLASFDACKNNNGHGNNLDGVDVSNPGQGHGGPNGMVDESGPIDDESKP